MLASNLQYLIIRETRVIVTSKNLSKMSTVITEEAVQTIQRGLSDWWTEETEYVFQRIERWAAFARGYNRLRSQRYSRGRLTMTDEPVEPGWNISANKLVVEDRASWNPDFHNLQRSRRRKSRPEEARINCCGTFNYQSNNNLDNPCLESYRYDHSIYFKTIGDIRGKDRNRKCSLKRTETPEELDPETSDQEHFEWNSKTIGEIECHRCDDNELDTDSYTPNCFNESPEDFGGIDTSHKDEDCSKFRNRSSQIWPIVDLTQLNVKSDQRVDSIQCRDHTIIQMTKNEEYNGENDDNGNGNGSCSDDDDDNDGDCDVNDTHDYDEYDDCDDKVNGNDNESCKKSNPISTNMYTNQGVIYNEKVNTEITGADDNTAVTRKIENQYNSGQLQQRGSKKLASLRKIKQSSREVYQPTIAGENNIVWPGVLLNYKKNVDPIHSPHCYSTNK